MRFTKNEHTSCFQRWQQTLISSCICFLLLAGAVVSPMATASGDQPNIIYIFVDDLSSGMVGFANPNSIPTTPNLDALAQAGLQFNQAYANAICSPSRGTLYTGYHLGHTINDENVENFRNQDIMPGEMVKAAGYATAVYGKWGFGSTTGAHTGDGGVGTLRLNPQVNNVATLPTSHGYDAFVGYLNHVQAHRFFIDPLWQADSSSSTGVGFFVTGNNAGDNVTNTFEGYTDDHHTREAMNFISSNVLSQTPFLIQMHFNSPHPPFDPGSQLNTDFYGQPRIWDQDYANLGLSLRQRQLAVMISRMDEHVGALVDRLNDPNEDGDFSDSIITNTVILFTSDNGGEPTGGINSQEWTELGANFMNGVNWRGGKRDLFEGGIRVPKFAYWPGTIPANQVTNEVVDLADFMPTVADLAGIDPPIGLDGVSYAGLLRGTGMMRRRNHHVWEHHEGDGPDPDGRNARWSVLKDGFKLIRFSNGSEDMYDLNTDPEESTPLDLASFSELREELLQIAIAEGVTQPADGYSVQHVDWIGADGDSTSDPANWSGYDPLFEVWVSVIANDEPTDSEITFGNRRFLGLEVTGADARQTIRVNPFSNLTARNELRVGANGRVQLDSAMLETARWVDVQAGGELSGSGEATAQLYNWGTVAPGLPADLDPVQASNGGDVNTGIVDAVAFNFNGVQDNSPLNATSQLNDFANLSTGFSFGPGTFPRTQANAGNEFNVSGWNTDSLPNAIAASDYVLFEVTPVPGIEMLVDEVTFRLWRNGSGAPKSYATLISPNGFVASNAIGIWEDFFTQDDGDANNGSDGIGIQHQIELTAQNDQAVWSDEPVQVRFYGWDTSNPTSLGNTHINAVSMTGQFRSTEGEAIDVDETGLLTLNGDFFHQPGATLRMQIAGNENSDPADRQFDQVIVNGTATLEGALEVEFLPDYVPANGELITLIDADSIAGELSGLTVSGLPARFEAEVFVFENDLVMAVNQTGVLLGDVNLDGVVDLLDVGPFVDLLSSGLYQAEADMNEDGIVDLLDIGLFVNALSG